MIKYVPTTSQDMLSDEVFKANIVMNIDTALATLVQNGFGNDEGLSVREDDTLEWEEFFNENVNSVAESFARQYVYTQVQLLFDTPAGNIVSILEKSAEQSLWRARLEVERNSD